MPGRLFSVEDANRSLLLLDGIIGRAQAITAEMRDVRDQLVDLRIVWGAKVLESSCPDHKEYEGYQTRFNVLEMKLKGIMDEVAATGAELKDVEQGLVDFTAARGEEVVYLCWRKGESRIQFWHPLEGGFAARQPLETL